MCVSQCWQNLQVLAWNFFLYSFHFFPKCLEKLLFNSGSKNSLTKWTWGPFLCRLCLLLSCLTRSRRCPGCVLEKTNLHCRPFGRREASYTITASHVSLPKKYQRGFVEEYWQMTWDWWVSHIADCTRGKYMMWKCCVSVSEYFFFFCIYYSSPYTTVISADMINTKPPVLYFPGKDSDNHCSDPHQLSQRKTSAYGKKCSCEWVHSCQINLSCASALCSSMCLSECVQERSLPIIAKTKPLMASNLEGTLNLN